MPIVLPRWTRSELTRIGVAFAFCLGVFYADCATSSDITEAFLYSGGFLAIYTVKRNRVYVALAVFGAFLTVLGALLEPEGESVVAQIVNRAMSIVVMGSTALLLIKVAESEKAIRLLATTDSLTGIFNRRHFLELAAREQRRAERDKTPLTVLMLDIDHFKRINDTYGHPVGDLAIKAMARACESCLRPTDILARYGGEEFIVALPQAEEEGALVVAERIREAVQAVSIDTPDNQQVSFTVSIGIAKLVWQSPFEQAIALADKALYAAKIGGRNRTCIEPAPVSGEAA